MRINLPDSPRKATPTSPGQRPVGFSQTTIGADGVERPDQKKDKGRPPRGRGNRLATINLVLLAIIMIAALGGGGWYIWTQIDGLEFSAEESTLYKKSKALVETSFEVRAAAGNVMEVKTNPATELSASFGLAGKEGKATVVLDIVGDVGTTTATVEWRGRDGTWSIDEAFLVDASGAKNAIPHKDTGEPMTTEELNIWHTADTDQPLGRAKQLIIQGKTFLGLNELKVALEENPNDIDSLLWRGIAFRQFNNQAKAQSDFRRVLELDPTHKRAAQELQALQVETATPGGSTPGAAPTPQTEQAGPPDIP